MPSLDWQSINRVVKATRFVELQPRNQVARRPTPRQSFVAKYAQVTVAITAASGMTLGVGKAKLLKVTRSGSSYVLADAGYAAVTVVNGGTATAVGKIIQVKLIDGAWSMDVDYC